MAIQFQEGNIFFNKIIILQSLEETDRKTGTELHADTISRMAWKDPNLATEIISIISRQELFQQLSKIEFQSQQLGLLPFIHFETHGTKEGLSLSSGEEIKWVEIIPVISKINLNTNNNLFISVAACWGGNIQFQVKINQPSPFRGFIGPMSELYEEDILVSFTAFFDELLNTNNFDNAITHLNHQTRSGVIFNHLNSEAFFDTVIENYLRAFKVNSGEKFKVLKNSIIDQLWESNPNANLLYQSKENLAQFIEINIDHLIQALADLKKVFLHLK